MWGFLTSVVGGIVAILLRQNGHTRKLEDVQSKVNGRLDAALDHVQKLRDEVADLRGVPRPSDD
jgi:hypothetical protein